MALLQLLHSMSTKPTEEDPTLSNSNAPATDQQAKEMEPTDLLLKPTGQGRDSNSSLEVQAMAVLSNVCWFMIDPVLLFLNYRFCPILLIVYTRTAKRTGLFLFSKLFFVACGHLCTTTSKLFSPTCLPLFCYTL